MRSIAHSNARFAHKEHRQSIIPRTAGHQTIDVAVFDGNTARKLLDLRAESVGFFGTIRVSDEDKIVVVLDVIRLEKPYHFGN